MRSWWPVAVINLELWYSDSLIWRQPLIISNCTHFKPAIPECEITCPENIKLGCFFFNFDPWLTPLTKPSTRDNWVLLITPPAAPRLLAWSCASWAHPSQRNQIICSFCHFVGQCYQFHCLNNWNHVTVSKLRTTPSGTYHTIISR